MAYPEEEKVGGIEAARKHSIDSINRSFYGDTYEPTTPAEKESARLVGIDQANKRQSVDSINRSFYGDDYVPSTPVEKESAREEDLRRTVRLPDEDMEVEPPVGQEGVWGGIEEAGRGLVRTAQVAVPEMVGKAAEYFDPEGGSTALRDWGVETQEGAKEWLQENPEYKQSLTARKKKQDDQFSVHGSAGEAMEMLGPSLAPTAGGAAIGGVIGGAIGTVVAPGAGTMAGAALGAKAGAWVGSAASLAAFFGSAALDTEKKVTEAQIKAGVPEAEAKQAGRVAGWKSGSIEAGGELVSKIPVFQVLRLLPNTAKKNAVLAATKVVKSPTTTIKDLLKVVGTEVATELGQGAGQQYVEADAGAGEMPTWDSTKGVIMPTILMSALTYGIAEPMGMAQRNALTKTLSDKDAPEPERIQAVNAVASTIKDEEIKALWLDHSLRQVQANAPVVLADDVYYADEEARRVSEGRPEQVQPAATNPAEQIPIERGNVDETGQQGVPGPTQSQTVGDVNGETAQPSGGAAEPGPGEGAPGPLDPDQYSESQAAEGGGDVIPSGLDYDGEGAASNDIPVEKKAEDFVQRADNVRLRKDPLSSDPRSDSHRQIEALARETVAGNQDEAIEIAAAIRENPKFYSDKLGIHPDNIGMYAKELERQAGSSPVVAKGDKRRIMGTDSIVDDYVSGDDGVNYELHKPADSKTGGGFVRVVDESGEVVSMTSYRDFDKAKTEFAKSTKVAGVKKLTGAAVTDRRLESGKSLREEWDSLDPDQQFERATKAHTEARTSHVSGGLPNKLAYAESEKGAAQVFIDVDSLKFINDKVGHQAGDELLRTVGAALTKFTQNAYHISGDEFVIQADSNEEAAKIMSQAQDALENTVLVGTKGDKTFTYNPGVSYVVGETIEGADEGLTAEKEKRQAAGKRAGRGQQPPSMVVRAAARNDRKDDGQKRPEVKKSEEDAFFGEFDPETIAAHPALKDPETIKALRQMADGAGWAEQGGGRIQWTRTGNGGARMPWVPLQEWFGRKPSGVTEKHIKEAVDRLEAGTKLTKPKREAIAFILGELNDAKVDGLNMGDIAEQPPADLAAMAERIGDKGEAILERGAMQGLSDEAILEQLKEHDPVVFVRKQKEEALRLGELTDEEQEAELDEPFDLAAQSEEDIKAVDATIEAQRKAASEADAKHQADLERKGFVLSGSSRKVDEMEARGQGSLYSYAGQKAKTADKGALAQAVGMQQAGADKDAIRKETGWFVGMDDKWRFELSDADMKLRDNPKATPGAPGVPPHWKLDALIDHPKLFEAYPELRSVRVETMPGTGMRGSYSYKDNVLSVTRPFNKEILVHEIQHVIQNIEKFARGGSPTRKGVSPEVWRTAVREMEKKYSDLPFVDKIAKDYLSGKITQNEYENKMFSISSTTHPGGIDGYMFELYQRLAGEIEARDTESRIDLDEAGRKEGEPYVSQGISQEDAIVRFGGERSQSAPSMDIESVRAELSEHFGARRISRMEASGQLHIVDSASEFPEGPNGEVAPDYAQGLKAPDNGVWINAAATANGLDSLAAATLAHEGTHASEKMVGTTRTVLGVNFKKLVRQLEALANSGDEAAVSAWERIPEGTPDAHLGSEFVAYFVEEAYSRIVAGKGDTLSLKAKSLYRRIMAAVKAWFLQSPVGKDLDFKITDELLVALVRNSIGRGPVVRQGTLLSSKYSQRKRGSTRLVRGIDRLVADAKTMESWKDWYNKYQGTLEEIFDGDADLMRRLLSVTSQASNVPTNVSLALKAYNQIMIGLPFTGYLPQVINNLNKVRSDIESGGLKINAFEKANLGDESAIAVDRHISQLFFNKDKPSKGQDAKAKATIRQVANKLGWTPRQTQAALWAANQVRTGTDPGAVRSYDKILIERADQIKALRAGFEPGGAGAGVSGRSQAAPKYSLPAEFGKSKYTHVEKRLEHARTKTSIKESLADQAKAAAKTTWHEFTRAYPKLEKSRYGEVLDVLRQSKGVSEYAHKEAFDKIWGFVGKMSEVERQVYTMNLVLPDMLQDIENGTLEDGATLPFGYTNKAAAKADLANFKAQAATKPEMEKALDARNKYMNETKEKLVNAKLLDKKVLENDAYYHHQVLDYMALGDKFTPGTSSGDARVYKKGWQRARMGSSKEYNLEYLEAEFEVVAQQISQLEAKKHLDRIGEIENIKSELQAKASNANLQAYMAKHAWANPASIKVSEMKADLGDDFRTWRDEIDKDTHTTWMPTPGTSWTRVNTVNDKIVEQAQDAGFAEVHKEEIGKAMAKGRDVEWVLPIELAETLDDPGQFKEDTLVGKASAASLRSWKAWTLMNPFRLFKYNLNNTSGDLDIALAFDYKILGYTKQAIKDLYAQARHPEKMSVELKEEMSEALRLQAIGSGFVVHDIEDFSKAFKAMTNPSPNLAMRYWGGAKGATNFRENILRLAAFRYFKERIADGYAGAGASNAAEVDAVTDPTERAAKLARELIGDYGNISHAGQYLRKHMIPFWAWSEINLPRYVRLIKNLKHEGASTGNVAGVVAWKATKLGIKMSAFASMVMLFNATVFPDEEDELTEQQRRQLHLILGRREDGSIRTIRIQGAFSDALSWFGAEDLPSDVTDLMEGKKTIEEYVQETAVAAPSKLWQGAKPIEKTVAETVIGRTTYPDIMQPRPIRDRFEHAARFLSLGMPYRHLTGKPSRGLGEDLKSMFAYSADPGEQAYYETRSQMADYLKDKGEESRSVTPTKRSNALYLYKQALKYGDFDAAEKYRGQYFELGGSYRGMSISVRRANPITMLPRKHRGKFLGSLTAKERTTYDRAQEWYRKTYFRRVPRT